MLKNEKKIEESGLTIEAIRRLRDKAFSTTYSEEEQKVIDAWISWAREAQRLEEEYYFNNINNDKDI